MADEVAFKVTLDEVAPPDPAFHRMGPVLVREFLTAVREFVLAAKDLELARGLDRHGQALAAIAESTRRSRRSLMDPSKKGRALTGPPLMPAYKLSRTRSLLYGEVVMGGGRLAPPPSEPKWAPPDPLESMRAKIAAGRLAEARDLIGHRFGEAPPKPSLSHAKLVKLENAILRQRERGEDVGPVELEQVMEGQSFLASRDALRRKEHGFLIFDPRTGTTGNKVDFDFRILDRSDWVVLREFGPDGREIPPSTPAAIYARIGPPAGKKLR